MSDVTASLCSFIDAAPCPAFAADEIERRLAEAGFTALALTAPRWDLQSGGRYRLRQGDSVVAFALRGPALRAFHLVGAHTDSPHLRLKPVPALDEDGYRRLAIEVYGGALWNSWLDRDLGLAGTLHTANGTVHRVRLHRPFARVPQLAIHLDRRVNEDGLKLNPQKHLLPMWGLATTASAAVAALDAQLAQAAGIQAADIVARDLSLYDLTPAAVGGGAGEFLFAGRLDNLASCHAGMQALIAVAAAGDADVVPVLACFDHEEVGSESASGADSAFLTQVLERVALACGCDRAGFLALLAGSAMLSADMAHAAHPGQSERHDAQHRPVLGGGPVLKTNANQRYATSPAMAARVRLLARAAGIPLQDFVARNDVGCGSTIGPAVAANLGISVADVGQAMLSMHSARECAAVADHAPYIALLAEHLRG
jgi:aspartyl aminopeptidase